ncbi:MAG: hypothetical protein AAGC55_01125 [Myxococcota bacterium]
MASSGLKLNIPSHEVSEGSFAKCAVVSIDEPSLSVEAIFNPNKIKISKSVPWNQQKTTTRKSDEPSLVSEASRKISVELFFDCYNYESMKGSAGADSANVEKTYIDTLMAMTIAEIATYKGSNTQLRPHFVMLVWGGFKPIKAVINSIDVEYTMFLPNGVPVRATCSLSLTEIELEKISEAENK